MKHEEWSGAGTDDGEEIGIGGAFEDVVAGGFDAGDVIEEPRTLGGAVVEDEIEHEVELARETSDVLPVAIAFVHLTIVDYGKAVVRGPWEEREEVDGGEGTLEVFRTEPAERL